MGGGGGGGREGATLYRLKMLALPLPLKSLCNSLQSSTQARDQFNQHEVVDETYYTD